MSEGLITEYPNPISFGRYLAAYKRQQPSAPPTPVSSIIQDVMRSGSTLKWFRLGMKLTTLMCAQCVCACGVLRSHNKLTKHDLLFFYIAE